MIRRRGLAGTCGLRDAAAQWTWPATDARTGRPGAMAGAHAPHCSPRLESPGDLRPHRTDARPGNAPARGPGQRDATGGARDSSKVDPTQPRVSRPDLAGHARAGEILKNLLRSA